MPEKENVRVIIAGSRNFHDFDLLIEVMDHFLSKIEDSIEIVSGKAKGADTLGERYALLRGYPVKEFPADWNQFGKSAGYKRNVQMAEYGTHCVVFHLNESKGSAHMINIAKQYNLKLRVVKLK